MRLDDTHMRPDKAGFLRRRSALPLWADLVWRLGLVFGLIAIVQALHWFGREGLKDNYDNQISFIDVLYFTTVTVTTVGYGDIVPVTPEDEALRKDALTKVILPAFAVIGVFAARAVTRREMR